LQIKPIIRNFVNLKMSKLTFNIVEIPKGESKQELLLEPADLDLSPYNFVAGNIILDLYRTRHFIRVDYSIEADVELRCDRSLEKFIYPIATSYDIIFKTDVKEETEDEDGAVRKFDFSSNTFNIEDEVKGSVFLEIPMQKLHPKYKDDEGNYKEFEARSFGNKENQESGEKIDPRWEELKKLKD